MKKKTVALLMALVLIFGVAAGGTVAWLTDKTETITNTFTYSDITITLEETDTDSTTAGAQYEYKMVPGGTITKDPKVTVKGGSEACWLFVKLVESANYDTFLADYNAAVIAAGWAPLDGNAGVYYKKVSALDSDQTFDVINGNTLTVRDTVTKNDMAEIKDSGMPTLSVTAYAIQSANLKDSAGNALDDDDIADIWNLAKPNP